MKSHITVLIDSSTQDIHTELKRMLEPHRLNEDDADSIRKHHWDYWFFPSENRFDDGELKARFRGTDPEILVHSSYVRNLPGDYSTSGIILLDGSWIDLQDFGWRLMNEPSAKNRSAWEKWLKKLELFLDENREQICTQVILHC
ncbi:hypothetical protein CH379_010875 [Leptospira ellisii]|uniref:Uncharacterized protein n=1 Tax=Leptospira ellisii TaxID=2023197 RepID=A0A2N0B6H1_9LEPT|nr:hypothetical protein [Leptospira ellisii]MDV6236124.1 hypothetical protein [Leptospira ellisii]PJZ92113.1 hypothetical protein CH379_14960 [Leptospira ellisii]PKA05280.1 hypothetical protein CH375_06115 [Leptospira ellisii]